MSIDVSAGSKTVIAGSVCIFVATTHPLVKLANALPWDSLMDAVLPDLKQTTAKGYWWMGRKILVRVYLAAYSFSGAKASGNVLSAAKDPTISLGCGFVEILRPKGSG